MKNKKYYAAVAAGVAVAVAWVAVSAVPAGATYRFSNFSGKPPIHVKTSGGKSPSGIAPAEIKKVYNLPATGGTGTIAIIDAYDDATIESDLGVFDAAYGLPACTIKNKCPVEDFMTAVFRIDLRKAKNLTIS